MSVTITLEAGERRSEEKLQELQISLHLFI